MITLKSDLINQVNASRKPLPYGVALLAVGVALLFKQLLLVWLGSTGYASLYAAVALSAWYGGIGSGLLATVVSTLGISYFFAEPLYCLAIATPDDLTRLSGFTLVTILISSLNRVQTAERQPSLAQQIQVSEAKLRRLFEADVVGILSANYQGEILEANEAFLSAIGYTQADLEAGINWRNLTPPEYLSQGEQSWQEIKQTGICSPLETEFYRKQGGRVPILVTGASLEDSSDRVIFLTVDLSDRQQAEAALRQSQLFQKPIRANDDKALTENRMEALAAIANEDGSHASLAGMSIDVSDRQRLEEELRLVTNAVPSLIAYVDSHQRYRFNNQTYEEWIGLPTGEIRGKHVREVVGESTYQTIQPYIETALSGQQASYESKVTLNGSTRYISATYVPQFREGKVEGFVALISDITRHKQAEEELRQSEERFAKLTSNIPGVIYQYCQYPDGRKDEFTTISSGCREIYKLPQAVLQNSDLVWHSIHPEDQKAFAQSFTKQASTGQQWRHEWRIVTPSGLKWIQGSARAQKQADGSLLWDGVLLDITPRKQAQAALQEREEQFRSTFEQAAVGIAHVALDGSWLKVNQKLCEIVGYPHEELLEKTFQDLTYPDDLEADLSFLHQTLAGEINSYSMEKRYIRKGGSTIWINLTVSLVREKTGEPQYFISVVEDISDRKQTEAALAESQERLRFALDVAQLGDWDLDLSTHVTRRSLRHDQIFGYDTLLPEWSDEIFLEHVHPEDRELVEQKFQSSLTTYENWDFECRIIWADQSVKWIWGRGSFYGNADGTPTHVLGLVTDITERKEAEAEIRRLNESLEQRVEERTAQLEAANRELEAFSYSVSHDLRAPLRHISGFVSLLEKQVDAAVLGKTGRRYLKIIAEATEKAGALIDDLLAFSRVGRTEMHCTSVDLNQLVQEVHHDLTTATKERNVQWQIEPLPKVPGDPALLRLVFQNLIDNAIKYTRPRSQAQITIGSTTKEQEVVVFIRDNGVGFDMQYAHKLFGVFQRLHSDRAFEGTGIGLANVQRIIHRHGGRVWAESAVDQGATFYFSLPKAPVQ